MKSKKKTKRPDTRDWARISELYEQLVDKSQTERRRQLENETVAVRREVEHLLQNATQVSGFLEGGEAREAAEGLLKGSLQRLFARGDKVGDFEILGMLGRGGFATVYLARQISLDRLVALKVSPDMGNEARTMAHLEHDHIVKVFSETVDKKRRVRLLAMQYIPGTSLDVVIAELAKLPLAERNGRAVARIIRAHCGQDVTLDPVQLEDQSRLEAMDLNQVILWLGARLAKALAYAHERSILHLDIKPSNILISIYGRPYLTDFNVSLDYRNRNEAREMMMGGTFNYMSPEQRLAFNEHGSLQALARISPASDVYSLGVVLKEMFNEQPMPGEAAVIVGVALQAAPHERWQGAEQFARALDGCRELLEIRAALPRRGPVLGRLASHPLTALTLVGAVPQVAACLTGVSYNAIRIVSHLTEAQQQLFHTVNAVYLPVVSLLVTVLWVYLVARLRPFLERAEFWMSHPEETRRYRHRALHLPEWGMLCTTLGWLPGSLVYPAALHFGAGPLSVNAFGHFVLSFCLAWLIALSYSYLLHKSIVLRLLYPRFWLGATDVRAEAGRELSRVPTRIRAVALLTGLIPLVGASLLLLAGPGSMEPQAFRSLQVLVAGLIFLGVVGIFSALGASQMLSRTVAAFTRTP